MIKDQYVWHDSIHVKGNMHKTFQSVYFAKYHSIKYLEDYLYLWFKLRRINKNEEERVGWLGRMALKHV